MKFLRRVSRVFGPPVLLPIVLGAPAQATQVDFASPNMDVYMYENAFNRGARGDMAAFGGPTGSAGVGSEDRLGQSIMGWNTAASIPMGLGASNYAITRVSLRLSRYDVDGVTLYYDPTYDSYHTYLPTTDPGYAPDTDADRPIELYGLGLRNGFTSLAVSGSISGTAYGEGSPFGVGTGEHTRSAYAWSAASPRADHDVSENVSEGFESMPFAIATVDGLSPGDAVPSEADFHFQLNLSDPSVLAYLQNALNKGQLGFTVSSLASTEFNGSGGSGAFPRFATRENPVPFLIPELEIEYTVVPEPAVGQIFILGAAALATLRAVRRRDRFS